MPDFQKIIDGIKAILELIFGKNIPSWIFTLLGYILLASLLLIGIWALLAVVSKIITLWKEKIQPVFYNVEEKRRNLQRQRFARHIDREVQRLNDLEDWRDHKFAELEAEVEAEGRRRATGSFAFLRWSRIGLRREHSLSKALENSREPHILLEGDPGSGKSVALRYVTQSMAQEASKSRSNKAIIPIFVNLKELNRRDNEPIDRNLIQAFILRLLNRVNHRDIEEFLEKEFERGLQDGTWLFLFDSFDEIPEVLGSTESDRIIQHYSDAISDFLRGMNQCRGIVSSRQFRGPHQSSWPRFRILPLSEKRKRELIHKADLGTGLETLLIGQLGTANDEIRGMAANPMFMGLLCEHMRAGHPFPENTHGVFEAYIETRMIRDADRLQKRFHVEASEVRKIAETVAFCMAADSTLGLSPSRFQLRESIKRLQLQVDHKFEVFLDALEYIKLARSETSIASTGGSRTFTFAHRRFQEYFATCIVLREPRLISSHELLTNARWRETTVVMFQTQRLRVLTPLFQGALDLLESAVIEVNTLIEQSLDFLQSVWSGNTERSHPAHQLFPWPKGTLHLLDLLQSGMGNRLKEIPEKIGQHVGTLTMSASITGIFPDQKWSLEVAGIAEPWVLTTLLRVAFLSNSQLLRSIAYWQVARLTEIPPDIAHNIRKALVSTTIAGRLHREWATIYAYLARLSDSQQYLSVARLLRAIRPISWGLNLILLFSFVSVSAILQTIPFEASLQLVGIALLLVRFPFLDDTSLIVLIDVLTASLGFVTFLFVSPILSAMWIYLTMWRLCAIKSAENGRFVQPIWWPFIPVGYISYLMHRARDAWRKRRAGSIHRSVSTVSITRFAKSLFKVSLGVLSVTLILAVFLSLLSSIADQSTITFFAPFVFFGIPLALWLSLSIQESLLEWRDLKRIGKLDINSRFSMPISVFLAQLGRCATDKSCVIFAMTVRANNLLVTNYETESILKYFTQFIEVQPTPNNAPNRIATLANHMLQTIPNGSNLLEIQKSSRFNIVYRAYFQATGVVPYLYKWHPRMLEELSLLIEEVQFNLRIQEADKL